MVLEDTLAPTHDPYEVGRFVLQTIFFIFSTSGGPFIWNSQLSIHARSRKMARRGKSLPLFFCGHWMENPKWEKSTVTLYPIPSVPFCFELAWYQMIRDWIMFFEASMHVVVGIRPGIFWGTNSMSPISLCIPGS